MVRRILLANYPTTIAQLNPVALWESPNYIGSTGAPVFNGAFYATIGPDLTGDDSYENGAGPTTNSAPTFIEGDHTIGNYAAGLQWGIGNHHLFCVITPTTITDTETTDVWQNAEPFGDGCGYLGFHLRVTGGIYYCDFYEWDTNNRKASISLGPTLGSKFVIQGKKVNGKLWARLNSESWVEGDACGNTGSTEYGPAMGFSWNGATYNCGYRGTTHAAGGWSRILNDWESNFVASFGATYG